MPEFRIPSRGPARPAAPGSAGLPDEGVAGEGVDLGAVARGLIGSRPTGTPGPGGRGRGGGGGGPLPTGPTQAEMQARDFENDAKGIISATSTFANVTLEDWQGKEDEEIIGEQIQGMTEALDERSSVMRPEAQALVSGAIEQNQERIAVLMAGGAKAARDTAYRQWSNNIVADGVATIQDLEDIGPFIDKTRDFLSGTNLFTPEQIQSGLDDLSAKTRERIIQSGLAEPDPIPMIETIDAGPSSQGEINSASDAYVKYGKRIFHHNVIENISRNPDQVQAWSDLKRISDRFVEIRHLAEKLGTESETASWKADIARGIEQTQDNAQAVLDLRGYLNGSIKSGGPTDERARRSLKAYDDTFVPFLRDPTISDAEKSNAYFDATIKFGSQSEGMLGWLAGTSLPQQAELVTAIEKRTDGEGNRVPASSQSSDKVKEALGRKRIDLIREYNKMLRGGMAPERAEAAALNEIQTFDKTAGLEAFDESDQVKADARALVLTALASRLNVTEEEIAAGPLGDAMAVYRGELSFGIKNAVPSAVDAIASKWGNDTITGSGLMLNPPHKAHNDAAEDPREGWLMGDFLSSLSVVRAGREFKPPTEYTLKAVNGGEFYYAIDNQTGQYEQWGEMTSVVGRVYQKIGIVPPPGTPFVWRPDYSASPTRLELDTARDKGIMPQYRHQLEAARNQVPVTVFREAEQAAQEESERLQKAFDKESAEEDQSFFGRVSRSFTNVFLKEPRQDKVAEILGKEFDRQGRGIDATVANNVKRFTASVSEAFMPARRAVTQAQLPGIVDRFIARTGTNDFRNITKNYETIRKLEAQMDAEAATPIPDEATLFNLNEQVRELERENQHLSDMQRNNRILRTVVSELFFK